MKASRSRHEQDDGVAIPHCRSSSAPDPASARCDRACCCRTALDLITAMPDEGGHHASDSVRE
jgi:hypothetical protein